MKFIKFFIALLTFGLFFSCSSDSNSSSGLALTADFTTRYVGEPITLTLKSGDADVTSSAVFYSNGTAISGNIFTASAAGTYTLSAKYNGKTSSGLVVTINNNPVPVTGITISSNKVNVAVGEKILYSIMGNNGSNVSPQATVYFNGVAQTGFNITMPTAGTIDVYATYVNASSQTLTSNTIQVNVINPINFNKRVLIEDFTGTWCGYCPRVAYGIQQVEAQTTDIDVVAIHKASGSGADPYNISTPGYSVSGYPTAKLNRTSEWTYPEPENVAEVVALTNGTNPRIGLAMNSSLSGSTMNVDVNVKFGFNFTGLKLVVYVLENGLIYNQNNYTSYFGGGSTLVNFEHNHVLRSILTDIYGDAITGTTNVGQVYTRNFNVSVPANVANSGNVSIVAFVLDSNGKALNSRTVNLGDNQTFEQE